MTPTQLAALQQAIASLKQTLTQQIPSALGINVSVSIAGDGAYSLNFQFPSAIQGKVNTLAYSGPLAELPTAE